MLFVYVLKKNADAELAFLKSYYLYILVEVPFCITERASIMLLIPFQLGYNKIRFKNNQK